MPERDEVVGEVVTCSAVVDGDRRSAEVARRDGDDVHASCIGLLDDVTQPVVIGVVRSAAGGKDDTFCVVLSEYVHVCQLDGTFRVCVTEHSEVASTPG